MAGGVRKVVYPRFLGVPSNFRLIRFLVRAPLLSEMVATEVKEKNDENIGHYVIASSRPAECQPLERCTLVPKSMGFKHWIQHDSIIDIIN